MSPVYMWRRIDNIWRDDYISPRQNGARLFTRANEYVKLGYLIAYLR